MCPRVGLQRHRMALPVLFKATSILFSVMAAPTYTLISSEGGFRDGPLLSEDLAGKLSLVPRHQRQRCDRLLISWLQSLSTVILEP